MFMGEYDHNTDDKGRLVMPAKFREQLGGSFIVTRGLDNCLFVYSMDEWKAVEEKFRSIPLTTEDARWFTRKFFSGAAQVDMDKQGRFLIPAKLRDYAGIDKEVVSIGVLSRIEIWDKERYEDGSEVGDMNKMAEHMAELGLAI